MDTPARPRTSFLTLLKQTAVAWNEDKALRLGAALAYYSVFSIGPLLVITLGLSGLFLKPQVVTGELNAQIASYVGPKAATAVQSMVESASQPTHGKLATIVGFVVLLIGAAGVFSELKDALNTIWAVKPKPGFSLWSLIWEKFLNFGMVLAIGFLLLTSLVLSTVIAGIGARFSQWLSLPPGVLAGITSLVSLATVTTLFAMIFKILPDVRIHWREVWLGAAVTAVLFEVGKLALGWYLGRESTSGAYGAAASVVLLLLWVYYTSCIMFFGAEFTRMHAEARGVWVRPEAHAEKVTADERASQGMEPHPQAGAAFHAGGNPLPAVSHGLVASLLKYLQARGSLAALEAREAAGQAIWVLMLAVIGCAAILAGWLLLATALTGVLMLFVGLSWLQAVGIAGGVHVVVIIIVALLIRQRLHTSSWFAETLNELKKDRAWLQPPATKP